MPVSVGCRRKRQSRAQKHVLVEIPLGAGRQTQRRGIAVSLNVEHELTRQRKWDKQETQEYMRHFNALKLDKLTSDPR